MRSIAASAIVGIHAPAPLRNERRRGPDPVKAPPGPSPQGWGSYIVYFIQPAHTPTTP
jgi:hypothetical protein